MDYTNVPKTLIYEQVHDIDSFPINDTSSLEYIFYKKLIKRPFINNSIDAPYMVLEIFNNAYYVAQLIKIQNHHELYFNMILDKATNIYQDITWCNHVMPATMALVTNLLHYYDHYETSDGIVKQINDNFRDWAYKGAPEGQDDYYELLIGEYDCPIHCFIWKYFNPRNIIEDINKEDISVQDIIFGIDYLIERAEKLHKDYLDKKIEFLQVIMRKLESYKEYIGIEDATVFEEAYYKVQKNLAALNIFPVSPKEKAHDNESSSTIETQLQARIKELEAENEVLKNKLLELQSKSGDTEESAELRARIEELENDLDALLARDKKSMMTASQAAIFLLTVCHNLGGIPNDKKKLSPILQRGWGFSEATAERALGAKATKEAAERVAALFRDISPKLERLINEFPDEFDRIKNQKLRDNNERKVKKS